MQVNIADAATPAITALQARLKRPLMAALGKRGEIVLRRHFLARPKNKRGWPTTNFWSQVRGATALSTITESTATVSIAEPRFPIHVFGGRVTPKRRRALALPIRSEAYGRTPREFTDLFLIRRRNGNAMLARRDGGALRIYYMLRRSVQIPANPQALPAEGDVQSAMQDEARRFLERQA